MSCLASWVTGGRIRGRGIARGRGAHLTKYVSTQGLTKDKWAIPVRVLRCLRSLTTSMFGRSHNYVPRLQELLWDSILAR